MAGVVYNPVLDELFTAERGKGAFLNDRRLRVAARRRLADAVVACGLPHHGRGDLELFRREVDGRAGEGRGAAPVRLGGARSRLGRRRPLRRLLGAQSLAVGHGRRHRSWCARPAASSPTSMAATPCFENGTSSPATRRFIASCCDLESGRRSSRHCRSVMPAVVATWNWPYDGGSRHMAPDADSQRPAACPDASRDPATCVVSHLSSCKGAERGDLQTSPLD